MAPRGRPRRTNDRTRRRVEFGVSAEELTWLKRQAAANNLSLSDYLRTAAMALRDEDEETPIVLAGQASPIICRID